MIDGTVKSDFTIPPWTIPTPVVETEKNCKSYDDWYALLSGVTMTSSSEVIFSCKISKGYTTAPELSLFNLALKYSASQWTYYENSQAIRMQGVTNNAMINYLSDNPLPAPAEPAMNA